MTTVSRPSELTTVVGYLDKVLDNVYGDLDGAAPRLPGFEEPSTETKALAVSLLGYRDACAAGLLSVWRAAAEFVGSTSPRLHMQRCRVGAATSRARPSCLREVSFAGHVVAILARMCDHWWDGDLADALATPILAQRASDAAVADALEANLRVTLHPPWLSRTPLIISERMPTVHIASPITKVGREQYAATRSLTRQLRAELERHDYLVESPSDFVSPDNRHAVPTDEMLTLSALHRASLVIVFADGGGHGTATTWTLAAELGIATLVLHRPDTEVGAARFDGRIFSRTVSAYRTPDEAVRAVGDFIAANAFVARRRTARLAAFRDMDVSHLTRALSAIDPIAFDDSFVTWEAAMMYLSDPVNWFQARPEIAGEIRRVLGARHGVDTGMRTAVAPTYDAQPIVAEARPQAPISTAAAATGPRAEEPAGHGLLGLLILAEEQGWPPETVSHAWELYRTEPQMTGLSARPVTTMTYDAWVALLRLKGWPV